MKRRDHSPNMHRFFIVSGIIAVYSMAILTTVSAGQTDVVHICCYSTDPGSYDPKCYDCNSSVYKNALMACLNMSDLPKNISFKAATCMEKNCQIQIPTISEAETLSKNPLDFLIQLILDRPKRSVLDNNVDGSHYSKDRHVVQEVSTFVSREERDIKFSDVDAEYFS